MKKNRILQAAFGCLALASTANAAFIEVSADISVDTTWTNNNTYILKDMIAVKNLAKLRIEPGTVIRGLPADNSYHILPDTNLTQKPGILLISRGSKIEALGTPALPIVFTNIDDPNVPGGISTVPTGSINGTGMPSPARNYDANGTTRVLATPNPTGGSNGQAYSGEWGGVVLCGKTKVAFARAAIGTAAVDPTNLLSGSSANGAGAQYIEGLQLLTDGTLGIYGGDDDDDNSGIMRFCSHRYGGYKIGNDNEINGLTLGAVGRNTVIEWQEVFNNVDDGFEFFAGTVNCNHLFSLYNDDDNIDYDQGFRGNLQFVFTLQDNRTASRGAPGVTGRLGPNTGNTGFVLVGYGDRIGECDGPENPITGVPQSNPNIFNVTSIGGQDTLTPRGLFFTDNSGGKWQNCLFEDLARTGSGGNALIAGDATSIANTETGGSGILNVKNTRWINFDGSAISAHPNLIEAADSNLLVDTTGAGSNLVSIGRVTQNSLDPRMKPAAEGRNPSFAGGGAAILPPAGMVQVSHIGNMMDNNALKGWSVLDTGWLGILTTSANVAQPKPTIGASGVNYSIGWSSVNAVKYSLERSVNKGKTYTPVTVVTGTGAAVSHVDTGATITPGTSVMYRVVPL